MIYSSLYTVRIKKHILQRKVAWPKKKYIRYATGLHNCLKSWRPHNRATMIKLIHRWIPTHDFLHKQHPMDAPLSPLCTAHKEDAYHILTCPNTNTIAQCQKLLYSCLEGLECENINKHLLHCSECNLTELLWAESLNKYKIHSIPPLKLLDEGTVIRYGSRKRHKKSGTIEHRIRMRYPELAQTNMVKVKEIYEEN